MSPWILIRGINPSGFTLIELLVVIAIIALLMAILLSVLSGVRKQARALVCRANLKQWGTIFSVYAEDYEGRFPREGGSELWLLTGRYMTVANPEEPKRYHPMRTDGIARCPMAVGPGGPGTFSRTRTENGETYHIEGLSGSAFTAWEWTSPPPAFRCSYGMNTTIFSPLFDSPLTIRGESLPYTDIFSLKGRARIPLVLDSVGPSCVLSERAAPPKREPGGDVCMNRHNGTINGLFLDWSVRPIGLKELWTLKWHPQWDTAGPWTKAGGVQPEDWPLWMRNFKDY